ncbi:ribonuclease kappa-B [Aethina tumida]|uniref:ribonuclease kappa-B n=1 Tax=Aethina tumida TaxID=116153 RepID=UPI00096B0D69|nr:ribonuclease kappa-B [Aethina tumida]
MPVCGPKLSLCGLIISVWGVIQLAFMGVFYYFHAVALAEDLPEFEIESNSTEEYMKEFYSKVDSGYTQNAYNCWIAALLYLVTLFFSAHQFWANNRSSLSV